MTATVQQQVAGNIHLIPIKRLKAAPWNPKGRVEERRLRRLQESIEDIGMIYPIAVDENLNVVDGHRRLAICKKLGWEHVPVLTVTSEFAHAYGSLQLNHERLTGNDILGVYLENPQALLRPQRRKVERIEEVADRDTVMLLYKAGLTAGTFDVAIRVVRYTESRVDVVETLRWLIKHAMGSKIRHLMEDGVSERALVKAITDNTPLRVKMTAE